MRLAALLVAAGLVLTGCGGSDQQKAAAPAGPTYLGPADGFCAKVTPTGLQPTERAGTASGIRTVTCIMARGTLQVVLDVQVSTSERTLKQYKYALGKGASGAFAGSGATRTTPDGWWQAATQFEGIDAGHSLLDTLVVDGNMYVRVTADAGSGRGTRPISEATAKILSAVHSQVKRKS